MNLIERAVCSIVGGLLELLLGKPNYPFTPAPDDWPPDGSMHFLRLDRPVAPQGLPPDAVEYEFAPNVGEDDPMVWELGEEILFRLCDSRQVLTVLTFDSDPPKSRRRKPSISNSELGTRFLRSLDPKASAAQGEHLAACLTTSCPQELFSRFKTNLNLPNSFIDTYLFSKELEPRTADEGLELVKRAQFQMQMYFSYGPNSLNFVFTPAEVDINALAQVVGNACNQHNILLVNPPILPQM